MTEPALDSPHLKYSRRRCLREAALVWRGGWARFRARLWIILLVGIIGPGLVWVARDTDSAVLDRVCLDGNEGATHFADFVSSYTSDLSVGVPVSLVLWTLGVRRGWARWRRMGLACLMATSLAGLTVQIVKRIVGRPRPNVPESYLQAEFGPGQVHPLYGPSNRSKLHSFPSGHTATSTATGATWIAANPIMVVPGVVYAATVGWSRMQLRKHYPIDVAGGAAIGVVCGLCFASTVPGSAIRLRRTKRRRPGHA